MSTLYEPANHNKQLAKYNPNQSPLIQQVNVKLCSLVQHYLSKRVMISIPIFEFEFFESKAFKRTLIIAPGFRRSLTIFSRCAHNAIYFIMPFI